MSIKSVWEGLHDCPFEKTFSFAKHSTIGCGGFAKIAYFPQSIDGAVALLKRLNAENAPYFVVGNMSNILPNSGVSKRILVSTKGIKETDIHRGFFGAGVTGSELLRLCKKHGKSGAEFLEGIPCTLGGAAYMNAGVAGAYMQDIVDRVLVFDGEAIKELSVQDCAYAYKSSVFMQKTCVILGVWLRLEQANETQIDERLRFYKKRRLHLPKGKSMGCVFKNPTGDSAGRLIENAGLKGLRLGGATVSQTHANFILNDDSATSDEIKTLIGVIKTAVFEQSKIRLEEEIEYLE